MSSTEKAAPRRIRIRRGQSAGNQVEARATVIQVTRADHSTSNQTQYADEFENLASINQLILPTPYDVPKLFNIIERSNMLPQCIEAYVTNTVMTGWTVEPAAEGIVVNQDEKDELNSFLNFANSEESLSTVMSAAIRDRESIGFGFIEVIRDAAGRISLLRHAKAIHTRLSARNPEDVLVKYDVPRGKRLVTVKEFRKFRRFCQVIAGRVTWFKEFGDPRELNSVTGLFEGEQGYTPANPATEILHLRNPSNEAYGKPRWINQVPNVLGSREVEEVNLHYFEDNTVPPMMLTVAGGRLTANSFKNLTQAINDGAGKDRQNKIMLVEAVGEGDSLDGKGTPIQLKVEKLTDARQSDSLFKDYDEGNQAKIRSSFRLPSVSVGMANEHNFATANVAMFAAETQVYGPLRFLIDEILNNKLVLGRTGLRMKTCKLVSRPPAITSPEMLMKSLTALNVMGAVTPRAAQITANKVLQTELPEYPQKGEEGYEEWMDTPIPVTTANQKIDAQQNIKDQANKDVEGTGDVSQKQPEHGQE